MNALTMLAETSGQFYDASMIPWLLERADNTKGTGEDLKAVQAAIAVTILKIAKPDQMASVKAGVDKYGTKMEKDLYTQVDKLAKACGDRAQCYLAEIEKGENQDQKNQSVGIKAAYMLAILGNEQTRDEIIARLDTIEEQGGEGANRWYRVELHEGRNREVRRLFEALGLTVSRLMRVRFGPLGLPPRLTRGHYAELPSAEVGELLAAVGLGQESPQPDRQARPEHGRRDPPDRREKQARQGSWTGCRRKKPPRCNT